MTNQDQPQRSGTTSADSTDEQPGSGGTTAAPLSRMLANPRRVRRA